MQRDYGINISVGRVYRLMNSMNLPKMKTAKPKWKSATNDDKVCENHLKQNFNQDAPNKVWASDFTYIKVNGCWCYLCVVMDLFSRKVIGWSLSRKHDVKLVKDAFEKAYKNRKYPSSLMFHSDRGLNIIHPNLEKCLKTTEYVNHFLRKVIHMIMHAWRVSLDR